MGQEHVEEEIPPVIKKIIARKIGEAGGKYHIEQLKGELPKLKNKDSLIEKEFHVQDQMVSLRETKEEGKDFVEMANRAMEGPSKVPSAAHLPPPPPPPS